MYSVILAMMVNTGGDATAFHRHYGHHHHHHSYSCYGCSGCCGCYGGYAYSGCWGCHGCHGCWGGHYYSSCWGCHGCCGCYGATVVYSSCYGCCGCCGGVIYSTPVYTYPVASAPVYSHPVASAPVVAAPVAVTPAAPVNPAVTPTNKSEEDAVRRVLEELRKTKSSNADQNARVTVRLPSDARLWVDSVYCPLTSSERSFNTPNLQKGKQYFYNLRMETTQAGQTVSQTRRVALEAGQQVTVDFRTPDTTTSVRR